MTPDQLGLKNTPAATGGTRARTDDQSLGLFGGAASLAFAALMARHGEDDYANLLATLDEQVTNQLRTLLSQEAQRLATDQAGSACTATTSSPVPPDCDATCCSGATFTAPCSLTP